MIIENQAVFRCLDESVSKIPSPNFKKIFFWYLGNIFCIEVPAPVSIPHADMLVFPS